MWIRDEDRVIRKDYPFAGVAQLLRALDFQSKGCELESRLPHNKKYEQQRISNFSDIILPKKESTFKWDSWPSGLGTSLWHWYTTVRSCYCPQID